jgi:hypothetical protein
VKGGFSFHPSDEDLSPSTPAMKKPLECVLSAYSNSETAVMDRACIYVCGTARTSGKSGSTLYVLFLDCAGRHFLKEDAA